MTDIDDSLAANAEPSDLGLPRRTPRREREGHFRIMFVDGPDPKAVPTGPVRTCRRCNTSGEAVVLHADPRSTDVTRTVCSKCQGEINADLHGYGPRKGGGA